MKNRSKFYIFSTLLWLAKFKKSAESTELCVLTFQHYKPHVTNGVRGQSKNPLTYGTIHFGLQARLCKRSFYTNLSLIFFKLSILFACIERR